jgi:hypothetical protein
VGGSLPTEGSPLVVGRIHPLHDVEGACLLALGHLVGDKDLVGGQVGEAQVGAQMGESQEVEGPLAEQAQVDPAAGQVDRLAAAALFLGPVS